MSTDAELVAGVLAGDREPGTRAKSYATRSPAACRLRIAGWLECFAVTKMNKANSGEKYNATRKWLSTTAANAPAPSTR